MRIAFHCKNCRKGLRISYDTCEAQDDIVLKGIIIKCRTCTRVISPKNFTRQQFINSAKDGKFFI